MPIQNGSLPLKVVAASFLSADPVAVAGIMLTAPTAAACSAVVQDGANHDIGTFNTSTSSGVSGVMFPFPVVCTGLSVPSLTGTGAILYIFLADIQ